MNTTPGFYPSAHCVSSPMASVLASLQETAQEPSHTSVQVSSIEFICRVEGRARDRGVYRALLTGYILQAIPFHRQGLGTPIRSDYPGVIHKTRQAETVPLVFYKKKSKTDPEPQAPQPSFYNGQEIVACPPFTGCPAQTHTGAGCWWHLPLHCQPQVTHSPLSMPHTDSLQWIGIAPVTCPSWLGEVRGQCVMYPALSRALN